MQDIKFTIMEYEESHDAIQNRIYELNAQIAKTGNHDPGFKRLLERRSIMYIQLWDIRYALRELREYVGRQEVNQKVG